MKRRVRWGGGVVAALLCGVMAGCSGEERRGGSGAESVSFSSAVAELTNVALFARTPAGRGRMESSWDRTGANQDWAKFGAPDADGLYTMAFLKGPGCVKRMWQTNIQMKQYRFFFDGEKEPRLTLTWNELFGGKDPFLPPVAGWISGAEHSYIPLPFAKSLRIALELPPSPGGMPFFHYNHTAYPSGVRVASFPGALSAEDLAAVVPVREEWQRCEAGARGAAESCRERKTIAIGAGTNATVLESSAPGVVRALVLNPTLPAGDSPVARVRMLRELVVEITWDDALEPSVQVPIGDFFCSGLSRRQFASLPLASLDAGFVSRFPMPFRKAAKVTVRNDGAAPVTVDAGWLVEPLDERTAGDLNYFHASWNASAQTGVPYRVLRAEGRGHYVGCYLISLGMDGTWNNLEADESIALDGEDVPSIHGTGLEDYFNGGWYYSGLYDRPLCGLVDKAAMRTCQYRFHLPDPVRFEKGMLMNFEFGDGNRSRGYMSSVAYWYQPEPHAAQKLPDARNRFPPQDPLELFCAMSGLFEIERIGHFDEAEERCLYYAEKYATTPFAPFFRLRAAAYQEEVSGYATARPTYEELAKTAAQHEAGQQAVTLMWFHESPTNVIVGSHMNGRSRIYLDGALLGEDDDPSDMAVFRTGLPAGPHELAVEITPVRPDSWVSLYLRGHSTNIITDAEWEYTRRKPSAWPRTDTPDVTWTNVPDGGGMLPNMAYWQFMPNGFVKMQSGKMGLRPWGDWDSRPGAVTAYLRRRFVVPEGK